MDAIIYILLAIAVAFLIQRMTKKSAPAAAPKEKDFRESVVSRHNLVEGQTKVFTAADVAAHNTEKDCWMIVDGRVYDITDFVDLHPGGKAIIRLPGQDNSKDFHGPQHTGSRAQDTIMDFEIGVLAGTPLAEAAQKNNKKAA